VHKEWTMRRFILVASLAALCPILCATSAHGAANVTPALATPIGVLVGDQDERPDIESPAGAADWLWDLLMDRLTVPLGPADQNIWPLGFWQEHWIVAADSVLTREDAHATLHDSSPGGRRRLPTPNRSTPN
jgi:hypothetical protein